MLGLYRSELALTALVTPHWSQTPRHPCVKYANERRAVGAPGVRLNKTPPPCLFSVRRSFRNSISPAAKPAFPTAAAIKNHQLDSLRTRLQRRHIMSVTATDLTVGTLAGTPVVFFPVPTPWPSSAGCDNYIYRQLNGGSIIAWDPVYPSLATGAESCYPPQQSSWWFQDASAKPSTALGPTFVCPEAYSAVHSTVLNSASSTQTQYTYCCPPYVC
jgi:hypothetical protein